MTINGTTTTPIEHGAYADVTVKLGIIKLWHKTLDICRLSGVECPLTLNNEGVASTFDLGGAPTVYQRILLG